MTPARPLPRVVPFEDGGGRGWGAAGGLDRRDGSRYPPRPRTPPRRAGPPPPVPGARRHPDAPCLHAPPPEGRPVLDGPGEGQRPRALFLGGRRRPPVNVQAPEILLPLVGGLPALRHVDVAVEVGRAPRRPLVTWGGGGRGALGVRPGAPAPSTSATAGRAETV